MAHQMTDANEKLRYYRDAADRAGHNAMTARDPDIRAGFLHIQCTWIYLADELEREMALEGFSIDAPDEVFIPEATKSPSHKAR
jgi:hypothetical protein